MTTKSLSQKYEKLSDLQHVLQNPDTYVGSVEKVESLTWVYDDNTNRIIRKNMEMIPAFYKIFDEPIVNSRDHVIRVRDSPDLDKKFVSQISASIENNEKITIYNDGNGIDVAKHPQYGLWIPEMIFGHLRTSTNYNKNEKKIVGGKNGFGIKLVFIWSTYGYLETVDHVRGLKYTQEFKNNLSEICPPVITKIKSAKPYTKITFIPDFQRFKMNNIDPDMMSLLKRRTFDIPAVSDHSVKKVKVSYNNDNINIKNFQQYIDLYIGPKEESKRVYESCDDRWEVAVAISPYHEFTHVSFVNGIHTNKGGKHVDHIIGQITKKLQDYIEKKKKIRVNPNSIKEQLFLFLRCDIENPSFDSQTKDYLNTPYSKFGSTCNISDGFIDRLAKMGIMETACSITEVKENKIVAKKTDGIKTKTIRGIANFIDANYSGTTKSKDCILILCEGLSALSGVVSGLSSDDRNTIGIYPLKGKLLNVRGENVTKIYANKEITDLKKILGLENGKSYDNIEEVHKSLRYGKIMILCDQDTDGSHIKGLCINLFHSEWASLIKIPGFLSFMNTPILRAKKGSQSFVFYNEGEYNQWKEETPNAHTFQIKYFKGLGTSTSKEFKEYFANKKIVDFQYSTSSDDIIDKIFNKKRTDDRKQWLGQYDKNSYLDTSQQNIPYEDFINKELIHFSTYDCARSIPNMVDGLKISLRKILFSAFKRNLKTEIKVAQFSGYVSEHSAYHHGEASLNGAIVNMAQIFVGSNNINVLEPNGQFGTRLHGGSDSASERYIFTMLNPMTRYMFPEMDDSVLNYLDDDGTRVEPDYYVPIIPFVLVNGISGIGTGFSCSIPSFNPMDMIKYLKMKIYSTKSAQYSNMENLGSYEFLPYYEGFKGTVSKIDEHKYLIKGLYEVLDNDSIKITELPIGTWTMPYTTFLESLIDNIDKNGKKSTPIIKDFVSLSTEVSVDFTVTFPKGKLNDLLSTKDENNINGLEKLLKMTTTVSTTNMHLFDSKCRLHKYGTVNEIIDEFYYVRYGVYEKRKQYLLELCESKLMKLTNKAKYIIENLNGNIDLRKKSASEVEALLSSFEFARIDDSYKYLTKMPMDSVTQENVDHIIKERDEAKNEYVVLQKTSVEDFWLRELETLETNYTVYKENRDKIQNNGKAKKAKGIKQKKIKI